MRHRALHRKTFALAVVLLLAAFGCTQDEPTVTDEDSSPSLSADEFAVTGNLVDAKAGVEPEGGVPGMEGMSMSPAPSGDADHEVGGLAVRPATDADAVNLDDCEKNQGTFVSYYTEETEFDPDATGEENFPENIQGKDVTVTGTIHENDDEECVLVAEKVEENTTGVPGSTDEAGEDEGGVQPGDESKLGSTAKPSGSPEATTEGGDFPSGTNNTDPIFSGTPSPDPCEGQDACDEHREGQPPTP
jgi:hypothetical protein